MLQFAGLALVFLWISLAFLVLHRGHATMNPRVGSWVPSCDTNWTRKQTILSGIWCWKVWHGITWRLCDEVWSLESLEYWTCHCEQVAIKSLLGDMGEEEGGELMDCGLEQAWSVVYD
jgi:hypothetical protein